MLTKFFDIEIEHAEIGHVPCTGDICSLTKTASSSLLDDIKQKPGHAYLHVIAMGSGDYYGENNNGDFFYEKDLLEYYKTFESAGVFIQHFNKDPEKSIGKVLKAVYNNDMHRVELAIEISQKKSPEYYDSIKRGERIKVSMGVKVPAEMCSYCGAITKNSLANRCEHLKFMMHDIMPNGQKVYAINMPPMNFFDISIVRKPADLQGHALFQKVASSENGGSEVNDDVVMQKVAELVKYIDAIDALPNGISNEELDKLKTEIPRDKLVRIIAAKRIILKPSEALVLGSGMPADRLEEASSVCDTPGFVELMLKRLAMDGGCGELQKYASSIDYTNSTIEKLAVRSMLAKEAANYVSNEDVFGNKRTDRPSVRKKTDLSTTKYPEYRIVFNDGKAVEVRHSPLSKNGIPRYYIDLVDAGLASHIVGLTVAGDERLLYRGNV